MRRGHAGGAALGLRPPGPLRAGHRLVVRRAAVPRAAPLAGPMTGLKHGRAPNVRRRPLGALGTAPLTPHVQVHAVVRLDDRARHHRRRGGQPVDGLSRLVELSPGRRAATPPSGARCGCEHLRRQPLDPETLLRSAGHTAFDAAPRAPAARRHIDIVSAFTAALLQAWEPTNRCPSAPRARQRC